MERQCVAEAMSGTPTAKARRARHLEGRAAWQGVAMNRAMMAGQRTMDRGSATGCPPSFSAHAMATGSVTDLGAIEGPASAGRAQR